MGRGEANSCLEFRGSRSWELLQVELCAFLFQWRADSLRSPAGRRSQLHGRRNGIIVGRKWGLLRVAMDFVGANLWFAKLISADASHTGHSNCTYNVLPSSLPSNLILADEIHLGPRLLLRVKPGKLADRRFSGMSSAKSRCASCASLPGVLLTASDEEVGETSKTPCAVSTWSSFAFRGDRDTCAPDPVPTMGKRPSSRGFPERCPFRRNKFHPCLYSQCMDQQACRAPHSTLAVRVAPCHRLSTVDDGSSLCRSSPPFSPISFP